MKTILKQHDCYTLGMARNLYLLTVDVSCRTVESSHAVFCTVLTNPT